MQQAEYGSVSVSVGNGGINCGENDNTPNEHSLAASVATDSHMTARGGGILHGDALTVLRTLPGESIHMCVTSPPYWGLRDYKVAGQLGLEAVHDCLGWATKQPCGECYICHMTEVFREVRRVLRADGTLWINEGDSYNAHPGTKGRSSLNSLDAFEGYQLGHGRGRTKGLKPKDLCGMPWRLALSLQADGWYWRDAIVWDKPAPMPESVRDRCTKSWEPILMFAKSQRYYFDALAIAETTANQGGPTWEERKAAGEPMRMGLSAAAEVGPSRFAAGPSRNKRNVWRLPPMPVSAAHFATYPLELPETCILAGTSERGVCPECGAPWMRQVQRDFVPQEDVCEDRRPRGSHGAKSMPAANGWQGVPRGSVDTTTTGWLPSCDHGGNSIPATVLDPFAGSGTTGLAALKHGRNFLGIELSAEYITIAEQRLASKLSLFA